MFSKRVYLQTSSCIYITFVHIRHIIAVEYYLSVLKEARIGRQVAKTEADLTKGV
jgi:hypothetical protein